MRKKLTGSIFAALLATGGFAQQATTSAKRAQSVAADSSIATHVAPQQAVSGNKAAATVPVQPAAPPAESPKPVGTTKKEQPEQ